MPFFFSASKSSLPLDLVQVDCTIFDWSGKIHKKYTGWLCYFFEDGSYLVGKSQRSTLRYHSPNGTLIWSKTEDIHHELDLSADKKRIFFLSDEMQLINGVKTRFDVLKIIDRDGNELHKWSTFEHWPDILKILEEKNQKPFLFNFVSGKYGPLSEYIHANSFKEIPPNDLYPKLGYMKPGNLIVGMNCLGLFLFLDPTLSRIEKVYRYQNFLGCNTHDAQVLPSGHILFFRNYKEHSLDGPALVEINPLTETIAWQLSTDSADKELSDTRGSVQKLSNGNFLYADKGQANHMSVVEISNNGTIVHALDQRMLEEAQIDRPYRAKVHKDLKQFLKNSW